MEADRCGHVDIMRVLIEHGADFMKYVDTWSEMTVLHAAAPSNTVGAIDVLVEAGANVEARDRYGETPLHCAAEKLTTKVALALLKHGANVNAQDLRRSTPLHRAAALAGRHCAGRQRAADMVDLLLRSGAEETIENEDDQIAAGVIGGPEPVHREWGLFGDQYGEDDGFGLDEQAQENAANEDFQDVRWLLANAPAHRADRTRRLRVYLVLCRAHPDRMQLHQSSSAHIGVSRGTRSAAKQARAGGDRADGAMPFAVSSASVTAYMLARRLKRSMASKM